jgi:hypothetical protein
LPPADFFVRSNSQQRHAPHREESLNLYGSR